MKCDYCSATAEVVNNTVPKGWFDDQLQEWRMKIEAGIIPDYDERCLSCLEEMGFNICPAVNQVVCRRCMRDNVVA